MRHQDRRVEHSLTENGLQLTIGAHQEISDLAHISHITARTQLVDYGPLTAVQSDQFSMPWIMHEDGATQLLGSFEHGKVEVAVAHDVERSRWLFARLPEARHRKVLGRRRRRGMPYGVDAVDRVELRKSSE